MPTCSICIDTLKSPVALPCGHVFCHDCLSCAVQAVKPYNIQHCCPNCRNPYTIVNINSESVPANIRPHLAPNIRKIFLDDSTPSTSSTPSSSAQSYPVAAFTRVNAENITLRVNCDLWRKRAEVHSAATLGLLGLARLARDHAIRMKCERDELLEKYTALKRKYGEDEPYSKIASPSAFVATSGTPTPQAAPVLPPTPPHNPESYPHPPHQMVPVPVYYPQNSIPCAGGQNDSPAKRRRVNPPRAAKMALYTNTGLPISHIRQQPPGTPPSSGSRYRTVS